MSILAQLGVDIVKLWNTYASIYLTGMWKTVSLAVVCTLVGCLIGFLCGVLQTIPVAKKDNALKKGLLGVLRGYHPRLCRGVSRYSDDTAGGVCLLRASVFYEQRRAMEERLARGVRGRRRQHGRIHGGDRARRHPLGRSGANRGRKGHRHDALADHDERDFTVRR